MKYLVNTLEFKSFDDLISDPHRPFTELNTYADFVLDNGVRGRVCTGEYAHGTITHPYEVNILYPNGNRQRKEFLNRTMLDKLLNDLDKLVLEQTA